MQPLALKNKIFNLPFGSKHAKTHKKVAKHAKPYKIKTLQKAFNKT